MCSNYEAQLQTAQENVKTCGSENKRLERMLASERQATEKSLKYQSQLEETLKAAAEETETQVGSRIRCWKPLLKRDAGCALDQMFKGFAEKRHRLGHGFSSVP